ncbi:MAG: ATP-binding protein, partial [Bacteroidota bacterium]
MKRDIYTNLKAWKESPGRKPLIIRGARQVGKTFILKEFGKKEYKELFYLNFEENEDLDELFSGSLEPKRIIELLSVHFQSPIQPGRHLIIFDEIQASNHALNALKYFNEKANEYHIICAGSLLGIKLSKPRSFPVGKVNLMDLYPLSFSEFLDALGRTGLRELIENQKEITPFPALFHNELNDLLRLYFIIGGMPEVVQSYIDSNDLFETRKRQREIVDTYLLDFAKHAPASDIPKLSIIWDIIPAQLGKENKKFIFSAISKSARARAYENAIQWLEDAGLIIRVKLAKSARIPLKGYADPDIFKIYYLDVGLLTAMANIPPSIVTEGNRLFNEYKGAFVENYVLQQLQSRMDTRAYYWRSEGIAEVDFLLEYNNEIVPLEVKSGINPRSKSMRVYMDKNKPDIFYRSSLLNLKKDGRIINIPLYAISLFPVR